MFYPNWSTLNKEKKKEPHDDCKREKTMLVFTDYVSLMS